jgi:ABC-type Fe3+ transport system permease subunit
LPENRRALLTAAAAAAALWPLAVFFLGPADLRSLAAGPYGRSLLLAGLAAAGALLLGLPAAWALAGSGPAGRGLRAGAVAVLLIPPYLAASAWMGLAWRLGLLALVERVLAFQPERSGDCLGLAALVLAGSLWPCVALPAAASLAALGREGREAALLARGRWGCLRAVELPAALPAALVGAGLALALALAEIGAPDIFMVSTAARDILLGFERTQGYAAAAGRALPLLAGALGLAGGLALVISRRGFAELARARFGETPAPRWAVGYSVALLAGTLGAVLAGLALNAGSAAAVAQAAREELPLVARSLLVALLAAGLAVLLAAPALPGPGRGGPGLRLALALGAFSLALVLPGALWGIGLLKARAALGGMGAPGAAGAELLYGPLALVWAGAARAVPGVAAVLAWGRLRVGAEQFEAGRTAGLGALGRLRLAAGLLRGPAAAALLLGVALALGDVGAAVLVSPPGWEPLAVRVFNAMHNGHGEVTAALALVTTAGAAGLGGLAAVLVGRR